MAKYDALIDRTPDESIVIVCHGSHDQSGSKLRATFEAVGHTVSRIYLADTLDRHNTGCIVKSVQRANEWLERHKDIIQGIPVTRWNDLKGEEFEARHASVKNLYNTCSEVRDEVNRVCSIHTSIALQRGKTDAETLMKSSVDYMLEELAGLSLIREESPCPEIYPGAFFQPDLLSKYDPRLRLPDVIPVSFERALKRA